MMNTAQEIKIRWPQHGEEISCSDGNKYKIGKKIGEGFFSVVFSCHDEWDNDLAMKILKPNGKLFEAVKASFEKEKESLLKFRHPAVTHMYNAFVCENLFYIITERCAYTIGDLIKGKDFQAEGWIKPMAKSLLQALAEIHSAGYAHRDIHLGNVFTSILTNDYLPGNKSQVVRFKIGDLGISRLIKDMPAAGTMAEWLRPPEVLFPNQFKPIDHRIDIYHLGLLFLQMIYKQQLLFTADEVRIGKPSLMAAQCGSKYNMVIARALNPDPLKRFESALKFWHAMKDL